ncbi:MAG: pectate lyase [Candidatus Omnitrophica bacterium]|nr:pectate lyase [Candidatus Omnitrophota bacterium]
MKFRLIALLALTAAFRIVAEPTPEQVETAMKKATNYLLDEVSTHGGFVALYTEDLSRCWGEVPARNSMIWIQDAGTTTVGKALLDVYRETGDPFYREALMKVANAIVAAQRPEGGWHYFHDFDPSGVEKWYEEVGSKAWGWEEFYHWDDNSTFDDDVTAGASDFLMDVYWETLDPRYKGPLMKALDFVLEAQYPLGGWPQRYPHPHGYSAYYTFNDGVTEGNIQLLWKAYKKFGNEEYRKAALRGMYFYIVSQNPPPQAGWSQAHELSLEPGGARSYEPKGLTTSSTQNNINALYRFYGMTGDRRFLRPIPDAIDWLESTKVPAEDSINGNTHPQFVELGTNKALYAHREGKSMEEGRYWVDYEAGNFPGHYGMQGKINIPQLRERYEEMSALSPEEAMDRYKKEKDKGKPVVGTNAEEVQTILDSLNEKGAWIEDLSMPDPTDWKYKPRTEFRGISVRTFAKNLRVLSAYLNRE